MKELPLIIFTLTMQAAIGTIVWVTILSFKNKENLEFKTNTLVALLLSAIGMVASLVHLGKPHLALTSMSNLASSWLSREIFLSGGFFVLLLVFCWLERTGKAQSLQKGLSILLSLTGLAAVFAMAQLYRQTIIPAWQSVHTIVDFYATTLVLGAIVYFVTFGREKLETLPRLDLVVLGVVLLQTAFLPGYVAGLGSLAGAGQESIALLAGSLSLTVFFRWLCLLGGILILVLSRTGRLASQANFLYVAALVLVVGEFLGRYLFYASGIPIGFGIL
ncbi:MAG TPA: dimethyl sulfoxide reductase anchor subunit [Peptococcaceae bacterium]|nr:dimethyl sulfoxide reductase anchor subunit [Peptococcaceae bacterium]